MPPSTSFSCWRLNKTTWVVREDDRYNEHPFIYVKVHPKVPLIFMSDTGCNEPSKKHKKDDYIYLRKYLENYPIEANDGRPLNPGGERQYYIAITHCHHDHIGGITQFLEGGTTEIIVPAAGRDFVEHNLYEHSGCKHYGIPVPYYVVTHWARSFERLKWPLWDGDGPQPYQTDIGITIIQTPGHTPDELAWYDHDEMHLSVGDSFYQEGDDGMPIIFPVTGNMIEWVFSMQKLLVFVRTQNALAAKEAEENSKDGWVQVAKRVRLSCAHQTDCEDGEEILEKLEKWADRAYRGKVPVVKKEYWYDEITYTWRDDDVTKKDFSLLAPIRLMEEARKFFNLDVDTE